LELAEAGYETVLEWALDKERLEGGAAGAGAASGGSIVGGPPGEDAGIGTRGESGAL
jgi:hypothetical protein